jgi:hypothetical protein
MLFTSWYVLNYAFVRPRGSSVCPDRIPIALPIEDLLNVKKSTHAVFFNLPPPPVDSPRCPDFVPLHGARRQKAEEREEERWSGEGHKGELPPQITASLSAMGTEEGATLNLDRSLMGRGGESWQWRGNG